MVANEYGENGCHWLIVKRVPVWEDEEILGMDGGDGCPTVWIYSLTLNRGHVRGLEWLMLCFVYFIFII